MATDEIKIIGEIDFHDVKVKVYHHPDQTVHAGCVWRMRNPDSCYTGIMYMNWETGKFSYPEGAIVPEQTPEDREMLPRFIIVRELELTDEMITNAKTYLDREYVRRNKSFLSITSE